MKASIEQDARESLDLTRSSAGLAVAPAGRDRYTTSKNALESNDAAYASKSYESFLQGSYGNDTNIFADSDVDIVMELTSTYYSGLEDLPEADNQAYHVNFDKADYNYDGFKRDVIAQLVKKFGARSFLISPLCLNRIDRS